MKIDALTPTPTMLAELGRRLARLRKQRGLAQEALAEQAGLGTAWLRILQALERTAAIDQLLPENFRSPLAEAKATTRTRRRKPSGPGFVWGDERP
jgi:transcriptional regulator with XRE-family HTH domain